MDLNNLAISLLSFLSIDIKFRMNHRLTRVGEYQKYGQTRIGSRI